MIRGFMLTARLDGISPNVASIHKAEVSALSLPFFDKSIPAGFPSTADDYHPIKIDLNKDLVRNSIATFFVRVCGDSMVEENICNGDLLVVDRAEEAASGDIIVIQVEREFYVRRLYHDVCGVRLCVGNPKYRDILIADTTDWEVWGKVIYSIRPQ
jgi:DNA polymerase V